MGPAEGYSRGGLKRVLIGLGVATVAGGLAGACTAPAERDMSQNKASDLSESETTRKLLESNFRLTGQLKWTQTEGPLEGAHFSADAVAQDQVTGARLAAPVQFSVFKGNVLNQTRLYRVLSDAISSGRLNRGYRIDRLGISIVDQSPKVFRVHLIGSEEEALTCAIEGFHTPTLISKCAWILGNDSYFVETVPELLPSILTSRNELVANLNLEGEIASDAR